MKEELELYPIVRQVFLFRDLAGVEHAKFGARELNHILISYVLHQNFSWSRQFCILQKA